MKSMSCVLLLVTSISLAAQNPAPSPALKPAEISGMYAFLREGEFVEVDVDDQAQVTGFISRYGESDADRGAFLDHLFTNAKLEGNKLTFATRPVHGISFEFKGTIERGTGKTREEDGFYVLRGTLTQFTTGPDQKQSAKSREVTLKSFPQDAQLSPPRAKD